MNKNVLEKNMQEMQKGSESAFETIYNLTQKKVFFVIYSIIKDYQLSEELMQDTYIKIRKNINSYKKNTNAIAWIITIARNLTLNAYNKRKRELITEKPNNDYIFSYNLETNVLNNLLLQNLFTALDETERQVVTLYTVGFKHKEIATQLNKPLGTVLWIYQKALTKMKNKGGTHYEK